MRENEIGKVRVSSEVGRAELKDGSLHLCLLCLDKIPVPWLGSGEGKASSPGLRDEHAH